MSLIFCNGDKTRDPTAGVWWCWGWGWWVMPILMTVLLFGSLVKTPARSHAIWISSSVKPFERKNICFWTTVLRATFEFCRNVTAVFTWKVRESWVSPEDTLSQRNEGAYLPFVHERLDVDSDAMALACRLYPCCYFAPCLYRPGREFWMNVIIWRSQETP